MAGEKEKSFDFYSVLGLKKECTGAELRNAYRKLAMKWHPDRCSASGNAGGMEEAKEKFQEIQNAYSVLSDSNKRLLYDFGVYDKDDDNDEQGMGDFIGEMAQMMSQTKSCSINHGSLEELQRLFTEMFPDDLGASFSGRDCPSSAPASSSGQKRSNSEDTGKGKIGELDPSGSAFCLGSNDAAQSSKRRGRKRHGRKQRGSSN